MSKSFLAVTLTIIFLGAIYFSLMPPASKGYGYMGYSGYNSGPSFWYFGGPSIYYSRDARSGSISGSKVRGGGPGAGK